MKDVLRHLGTLIDEHGHITGLWEMRDGQPLRQRCAYHYDDQGDLIAAQDENGAARQLPSLPTLTPPLNPAKLNHEVLA